MSASMQIVVADDDPVIRKLLQLKLEGDGHRVSLAADGREALDLASTARPELLVLDITMPGLDGLEVTRRVREQPETASVPIVLLTSRDTEDDIAAGWHCGANYYLTKPLTMEHLNYFIECLNGPLDPGEPWETFD